MSKIRWNVDDNSTTFAHAFATSFLRPNASKAATGAEIVHPLGAGIMARLFKFGLGLILCAVLFATAFWAYEEVYFLYSDSETEKRKAIEIMQYTAKQKHFDVNTLRGPFPHDYSNENREFIWTLDGKVAATIYFVYVPHDYEIRFSGKMSEYGK